MKNHRRLLTAQKAADVLRSLADDLDAEKIDLEQITISSISEKNTKLRLDYRESDCNE